MNLARSRLRGISFLRLCDDAHVDKYNVFIFEVVKASVAALPKQPETLHYTVDGVFMVFSEIISRKKLFPRGCCEIKESQTL